IQVQFREGRHMPARPVLLSLLTLVLLLPVMYRRHQRRSGVPMDAPRSRRGRLAIAAVSTALLVGVVGGAAFADNGDRNGADTGTKVTNLIQDTTSGRDAPTPDEVATATEKNRVAINITWLMLGGILVLFMQAGFALVET